MQLFERADYALDQAKRSHRVAAVVFSQDHETSIRDEGRIEQALRHAVLEEELSIAFQPIAAQACLIGALTETLVEKALRAAASWTPGTRLSFNLSAVDLTTPATVARVCEIVTASRFAPGRIDVEVTETAAIRDFAQVERSLAVLRQLGVKISLDDFGTGFSSLSHVHRLKLDKIKIDRSFVSDIEHNPTSGDIVRTIVSLCQTLNVECVVEGSRPTRNWTFCGRWGAARCRATCSASR